MDYLVQKTLLGWFLLFGCLIDGQAQGKGSPPLYPEVGYACPSFTLHNIQYFSKAEASLDDFKGKWLILDFWNKDCSSCIANFPKTNEMQKEFEDKVQFMMVAYEDKENQIRELYKRFQRKEHLTMPCAFDSGLCNRFNIYTAPHIVVVDDKGVVRGVTRAIKPDQIQAFLEGKTPDLLKTYRFMNDTTRDDKRDIIHYDAAKPFLIDDNGGKQGNFLFRSVLSGFNSITQERVVPSKFTDEISRTGKLELLGATLIELYYFAYIKKNSQIDIEDSDYGKIYPYPELNIRDTSIFNYSFKGTGKNLYCYSLIVPKWKADQHYMQMIMQQDLRNYFGISAQIIVKSCPYWRLVATDSARAKLRTKGGVPSWDATRAWIRAKNHPMHDILRNIFYNQGEIPIILDETGINGNIDIDLDCLFVDWEDIVQALQKKGLNLVQGFRDMKVLEVHDARD